MVAEVGWTLKTCEVCQVAKHGGTWAHGSRQKLYAGQAWQKAAIDLVGPFPDTAQRNNWILVLTAHFTRWQDTIPLLDATVATVLYKQIFVTLGCPSRIIHIRVLNLSRS